jgi:anti-sigma B factor antagonist
MKLSVKDAGNVKIIELKGRLTMGQPTGALAETVKGLLAGGHPKIVINLSGVEYVDSMGIGELVATKKRAVEKGGDALLLMPSKTVYNVLSIVSLHLIFKIFDDEAQAVGSF